MKWKRVGRSAIVASVLVLAQFSGIATIWTIEPPANPAAFFRRGDTNTDGTVDLSDGLTTLRYLFLGGDDPVCLDASDADDTGEVELTDAFSFLFTGGAPLPSPALECGEDPTPDLLDCAAYSSCPQSSKPKFFTDPTLAMSSGGDLDVELPVISEFELPVVNVQTVEIETTNRTNGSQRCRGRRRRL